MTYDTGALYEMSTQPVLTPKQQAEIDTLKAMSDDEIDTSDIPEVTDWSNAKRGMFHRLRQGLPPIPKKETHHKPDRPVSQETVESATPKR